jgi:hypothetical protein
MAEPKPKSGRGWLAFLGVMTAVGLAGYFGRSGLKHVVMGMPRSAARIVLLGDREPGYAVFCGGLPPPAPHHRPVRSYPCPYIRMEYPEYGFDVIYHGEWRGPDGDTSDWKAIAVEDRE